MWVTEHEVAQLRKAERPAALRGSADRHRAPGSFALRIEARRMKLL
jgi:hypothetical protein